MPVIDTNTKLQVQLRFKNEDIDITPELGAYILDFIGDGVIVSSHGDVIRIEIPGNGEGSIADNSITNSKLRTVPALTIKGNKFINDSTPQDLTVAEVKALLSYNKGDFGLGNVDNTSDANKPLSNADQQALATKAPLASPAFTGNPTAPTQVENDDSTKIATTAYVDRAVNNGGGGGSNQQNNIREVDSNITLNAATDGTVILKSPATQTTLPTSVEGVILRIKNKTGANIKVLGHLDESSGQSITVSNSAWVIVQGDGTTWFIIG